MPLPEVARDVMFGEMHSHFVPAAGTNVEFTSQGPESSLAMSSSGGGLFGRPMTRKSHGALLILGIASRRSSLNPVCTAHILVHKNPEKNALFSRKI